MWNSKQLAMRDPALAAVMGLVSGADFGAEAAFARGFQEAAKNSPSEFGYDYPYRFGHEFGNEFGADAAPGAPMPTSTPEAALALWRQHHTEMANSRSREMLLDPNKNSRLKVEKYIFQLVQTVLIGTATAIAMSNNPATT